MPFSFAAPWLLSLLVVIPLLATLPLWGKRFTQPAGLRFADNTLVTTGGRSWRLNLRTVARAFRLLALALIVIALARPQTGQAEELIKREGVDIALALDMSGSMSALDYAPLNRLEAAKQVITAFTQRRSQDRIGLVVFSKDAFVQSPLTIDHDTLRLLIDEVSLAAEVSIDDGTAIGMGMAVAANLLKDSPVKSKIIVLLTDGVNTTGEIDPLTAAAIIETLGIKLYAIGVGLPGVVQVPLGGPSGGSAIIQESEFDEELMRRVSEATNGSFFKASDESGLQKIFDEIDSLEKSEIEVRTFTRSQEWAVWFLGPAVIILMIEAMLRYTLFRQIP